MSDDNVDYNSMSDDAFLAASGDLPFSSPEPEIVEEINNVDDSADVEDVEGAEVPVDGEAEAEANGDEDTQHTDGDTGEAESGAEDNAGEDDGAESGNTDEDTDGDDGDQETDTDTDDGEFDFKAGYEEIFAPFKANGREMQVDNIEDARRLMQMGAGATKQMLKLKPHLMIVKSLKDNGLLDQGKLDHLIELSQGNPDAIAKLMMEKEVDPLDIETEGAENYKPKGYGVSESEYNIDQAIESIRGTDGFEQSMDVMGEQWDQGSREIIAEHPEIVSVINDHVQSGVFDVVQAEVDKERALGRMSGMSDVEAYREAAGALQKKGTLVNDGKGKPTRGSDSGKDNPLKREASKVVSKKAKAKTDAKKRAAAPSGGSKASKQGQNKDLSKLSDEDFLREFENL